MHRPLFCMVKMKLLAQFLVDHHSYPFMPNLVFFSQSIWYIHWLYCWLSHLSLPSYSLRLLFSCDYYWLLLIIDYLQIFRVTSFCILKFSYEQDCKWISSLKKSQYFECWFCRQTESVFSYILKYCFWEVDQV